MTGTRAHPIHKKQRTSPYISETRQYSWYSTEKTPPGVGWESTPVEQRCDFISTSFSRKYIRWSFIDMIMRFPAIPPESLRFGGSVPLTTSVVPVSRLSRPTSETL